MTRSSNPLPDFNASEWREACAERRQIRARLAAIEEELVRLAFGHVNQKLAVKHLTSDISDLIKEPIVRLQDYRDLNDLVADAVAIRFVVNQDEIKLKKERAALEAKLAELESEIKQVKQIFRRAMRKVVSLEGYRSKAASA